jgi:lysylphosphatidylglycerol synthetase-like protein (DUF2156 family)
MTFLYKILTLPHFAGTPCASNKFLFPTWYTYLPGSNTAGGCSPELTNINGVWLIVAAVIEILLRLAALFAVGIIIYAGIEYSISQGNPERTSRALNTIIGAAAGLAIVVIAAVLITFIAGSFH